MGKARLAYVGERKQGDIIVFAKEITSSDLTTTAAALTSAVTGGRLVCIGGLLATDSTGLAGGTNLEISVSGETYGMNVPLEETFSNLGASISRAWGFGTSDDSTNDRFVSVTAVPFFLDNGDSVQINSTSGAGTGAGKILIVLFFRKIDASAYIASA